MGFDVSRGYSFSARGFGQLKIRGDDESHLDDLK